VSNEEVVYETARWIEGRLGEALPIPAIAAKAGYSLFYFERLFAGILGLTPKEYVLRRKLSEAARELAAGRRGVTDVAFSYGFSDSDSFSRAFKRFHGTTPSAVRRGARFEYHPAASRSAASPRRGSEPCVRASPGFLVAGWLAAGEDPSSPGRLWALFPRRAPTIPRKKEPIVYRQLAWWNELDESSFAILVGVEMESLDSLPIDLVGKAVPACDCLVFRHEGPAAEIGKSYERIYGELLPAMDRKPSLPFNFESYPAGEADPASTCYWVDICVPLSEEGSATMAH